MIINIISEDGHSQGLDVPEELTFDDLKILIEAELGIPCATQQIKLDNSVIDFSGKLLKESQIKDGSTLSVSKVLKSVNQKRPMKDDFRGLVEQAIQQVNINANMAAALEHHPEAFAPVPMLFVKMTVNGHAMAGFVDTGAQSTIISEGCAHRVGIGSLIDNRFQGIARGVGKGRILGRVHAVIISIGSQHLSCSLTVIDGSIGVDFIFGLDMLRRHQACIDFKSSTLVIHGEHIHFMSEFEAPKNSFS